MRRKQIYSTDRPPALLGGSPPAGTLALLIVFGVVFLLMVFSGSGKLAHYSALWMPRVVHGDIWRVVTSPFFFGMPDRVHVLSVLGSGVVLWGFGSLLERWWGTKKLVFFFLFCTIVSNLVAAFFAWVVWPLEPSGGIAPGGVALATAGALLFRRRGLGISFRGQIYGLEWWIVLIVIGGILILGSAVDLLEGRPIVSRVGDFAGGGLAYLFVTEDWRPWVRLRRKRIRKLREDVNKVVDFPGGGKFGGRGQNNSQGNGRFDPYRWN